jgi:hypothetical protein
MIASIRFIADLLAASMQSRSSPNEGRVVLFSGKNPSCHQKAVEARRLLNAN